jgi:hypothetical protein
MRPHVASRSSTVLSTPAPCAAITPGSARTARAVSRSRARRRRRRVRRPTPRGVRGGPRPEAAHNPKITGSIPPPPPRTLAGLIREDGRWPSPARPGTSHRQPRGPRPRARATRQPRPPPRGASSPPARPRSPRPRPPCSLARGHRTRYPQRSASGQRANPQQAPRRWPGQFTSTSSRRSGRRRPHHLHRPTSSRIVIALAGYARSLIIPIPSFRPAGVRPGPPVASGQPRSLSPTATGRSPLTPPAHRSSPTRQVDNGTARRSDARGRHRWTNPSGQRRSEPIRFSQLRACSGRQALQLFTRGLAFVVGDAGHGGCTSVGPP